MLKLFIAPCVDYVSCYISYFKICKAYTKTMTKLFKNHIVKKYLYEHYHHIVLKYLFDGYVIRRPPFTFDTHSKYMY